MALSQPGIYNILDYGASSLSTTPGSQNARAFRLAIADANTYGGGIILVPSNDNNNHGNVYNLAPEGTNSYCVLLQCQYPLMILGTGGAPTLKIQASCDVFATASGGTQYFTGTSLAFRDFIVQYAQSLLNHYSGIAFNLNGAGSSRLERMQVEDCQFPIYFTNTLIASVSQCSIGYTVNYPSSQGTTCITVGKPGDQTASQEIDISDCVLNIPTTISSSVGIDVTQVNTDLRVRNTQITGAVNGIQIDPSRHQCVDMWFSGLTVSVTGYGALIQPKGTSSISNVNFSNCIFEYIGSSAGTTSGIYIDTSGQANSAVDTVRLENCSCVGFPANGVEATSGQNIAVIGGLYTSNANAGIGMIGSTTIAPTNITIRGVSCPGNAYGSSTTQAYGVLLQIGVSNALITGCAANGNSQAGIFITNTVSNALVSNCDATGNSVYGISVAASCSAIYINNCNVTGYASGHAIHTGNNPGTLQVTNCPGYNDQKSVLATSIPVMSGANFNGTNSGYYGPVVFYTEPYGTNTISGISIDGNPTNLTSGTFFIGPPAPNNESTASITYSGTPYFLMVGK
jgi:hypothetical protein